MEIYILKLLVAILIAICAIVLLGLGIRHLLMKECVTVDPCFPFLKGDLGYEKLDSNAKRKVLVIVDFQKDFYDKESGTLYVPGAENCVKPICELIRKENFDNIIVTLDWHRFKDHSFKENGGEWPVHCLNYDEGASLHPEIMKAIKDSGSCCDFFLKGNCATHEEYGAFEKCVAFEDSVVMRNFLCDSQVVLNYINQTDVFVCGLAGDYCVAKTFQNLEKIGFASVKLFDAGIAYINPPQTENSESE